MLSVTPDKGPVVVTSYSPDDAVTLVLDDSGNADLTPKNATLTPAEDAASYDRIEDFAPNTVYWSLGSNASVSRPCDVDISAAATPDGAAAAWGAAPY